ncbi:MAG: DUF2795 domain-containing protein [Deltaproteobacteria bacterium]|nr:DUF2795 domain-containing protein [Deltaproteobacteria bacterium]
MKRKTEKRGAMTVREAGRLGGKKVQRERDLRDTKQVRGHAYDKPGPPKGTAFGIAAITQALEGVDFPATKEDLLARAGDRVIEYRKGQGVPLSQIIEDLEEDEFPSMASVVEAVSDALKEEGLTGTEAEERPSP